MMTVLCPRVVRLVPSSFWRLRKQFVSEKVPVALRSKKEKSTRLDTIKHFVDLQYVRVIGGNGGDGAISFLQLWCNPEAGPDGGDGGNGGHVIFQASSSVNNLNHVKTIIQADSGEKGYNKDCHGRNAQHTVVKVPIGTIVKTGLGKVAADLKQEGMMFVAARGGAGGHGNHYFVSDTQQAPQVAEYGGEGESLQYVLEVQSMAHVGLIGFPNAGKSTLLQAISRARPKIASYPFTTLKPHLGIVKYDDHEQITVADLPGLIPGSHKNRGLGIQFLKHAERCSVLLFMLDLSDDEPWMHLDTLQYELNQFSPELATRPQIIVANKIDLPEAQENLPQLKQHVQQPVVPISAKVGTNVAQLLQMIRETYDDMMRKASEEEEASIVEDTKSL